MSCPRSQALRRARRMRHPHPFRGNTPIWVVAASIRFHRRCGQGLLRAEKNVSNNSQRSTGGWPVLRPVHRSQQGAKGHRVDNGRMIAAPEARQGVSREGAHGESYGHIDLQSPGRHGGATTRRMFYGCRGRSPPNLDQAAQSLPNIRDRECGHRLGHEPPENVGYGGEGGWNDGRNRDSVL